MDSLISCHIVGYNKLATNQFIAKPLFYIYIQPYLTIIRATYMCESTKVNLGTLMYSQISKKSLLLYHRCKGYITLGFCSQFVVYILIFDPYP